MLPWNRCEKKFAALIAERRATPLAARDAAALESHLQGCSTCRAFESDLRELVDNMKQAAAADPIAHPTPQQFAALAGAADKLEPGQKARLERHLSLCGDCRAEWNVATNWNPDPVAVAAPRPARWGWFGAGALATASAAAVLFAMMLPDGPPRGIGARPALESAGFAVQLRGAHHRSGEGVTALPVPAGIEVVLVGLTVEAAPGTALELAMLDEQGKTLERAALRLDDPEGLLLFSIAADRLPGAGGEFEVRIAGTAQRFRYPFRVERSGG
jgi:hypothetical protein